jgi:hypothetical protein
MSNDKCMCQEDNSWPCDDVGSYYCLYWGCVSWATWQGAKYTAPDCTHSTCNPVNFTILKPSDWTQGQIISIRINGKGLDPGSLMHLKSVTAIHGSSSYQVFHSFYEMRSEFSISVKAKILFLSLVESITQTLNVTSCFVCGGTHMGDHWPWDVRQLDSRGPFNETAFPKYRKGIWLLKTSIIRMYLM